MAQHKKNLYKVVGINDRTASQLTSWEGLNASKPIPVGCVYGNGSLCDAYSYSYTVQTKRCLNYLLRGNTKKLCHVVCVCMEKDTEKREKLNHLHNVV